MPDEHPDGVAILHISDIHRTPDEPVSNQNIISALSADLKRQQEREGLPRPDFLVISGDLTQSANKEEYDDAYDLINRLKDDLRVPDFNHVILAPGNHDINWGVSQAAFKTGFQKPDRADVALVHNVGPVYFWTDEDTYAQRLGPFRDFYRRVYNREYGSIRREQYDIWAYPDLGICFVGLNSCDRVDHLRFQGAILEDALHAANERLANEASTDLSHLIKIAVWHHDFNWLGDPKHQDSLDPSILGHLANAEYDLALCGHTHRANFNEYRYPGFHLPVIAAGSLCAGPRQREESIPRLYNLIHIRENSARVYTRSRETKNAPWRPYARWDDPPRAYYDVPLVKKLYRRSVVEIEREEGAESSGVAIPKEYYTGLIHEFEYLDIAGIDKDRAVPLKLSKVYVKLRVIPDEDGPDEDGFEESGHFNIHTALHRYKRLVIVGDPGSGKSTFLKFIALMVSRARIEKKLSLAETKLNLWPPLPVPVFISLWDLSDFIKKEGKDDGIILRHIVEQFDSAGKSLRISGIEQMLAKGICCLLFDGLDECQWRADNVRKVAV